MNPKDKKPPVKKVMPLMTPRNLVPATPMRFSGASEPTAVASSSTNRVIKGPQKSGKDKSSIPLPPGYVDRAAQRRSGQETTSNLNIFDTETTETETGKTVKNDPMKNKLEFLEETAGIEAFPSCSQIQTERIMKLILNSNNKPACQPSTFNAFKDNEAFLQFKSIEESKVQPFDPFNRPRKVFRGSKNKKMEFENENDLVLERVKEAVKRLEIASERHQKYLETLNASEKVIEGDDIFPEAGVFDEKAVLENVIKRAENNSTGKLKAKNRLFSSKTAKIEKEVDVFELIAQKSLEEEANKNSIEETDGGGLFGFSNILPKLSRLEGNENNAKGSETKLTGAYASILSENDEETESNEIKTVKKTSDDEDTDDYLYPGYLENDPIISDSDNEGEEKMPKNKRKLARKEDKEATKVEKLVKSKFGVDLSK